MRGIKFRAWNGLGYVFELVINIDSDGDVTWLDGSLKGDEPHAWKEEGLEQFTGLVDKNGVDIYEGDVVSHPVQGVMKVIYPMSKDFAGFGLESLSGRKNTLQDAASLYEVIGNIHENPIFRLEGNR